MARNQLQQSGSRTPGRVGIARRTTTLYILGPFAGLRLTMATVAAFTESEKSEMSSSLSESEISSSESEAEIPDKISAKSVAGDGGRLPLQWTIIVGPFCFK